MAEISAGERIRTLRLAKGISQADLAATVEISGSYLNLIEKDKRTIGGTLLRRLADVLEVPSSQLSGVEDAALVHDLMEIGRVMGLPSIDQAALNRVIAQAPSWGHAMVTLFQRYKDASETAIALSDRLSQDPQLRELSHSVLTQISSIRSFAEILKDFPDLPEDERERFSSIIATQSDQLGSRAREMINLLESEADQSDERPRSVSAVNEVEDLVNALGNHLPTLEEAVSVIRGTIIKRDMRGSITAAMIDRLTQHHGVEVVTIEGKQIPDHEADLLSYDPSAPRTATRFRIAFGLIRREIPDLIDALAQNDRLSGEDARIIARRAFTSYAAGALLFPYDAFLQAAEQDRYDLDRLAQRFDGSFEQIAHRLTTLRKPGAEGVPFAFLRCDPSGNISKPLSLPGLRMPRLGGACPIWAVYAAFSSPGRTIAQLAALPSGERFLFVARRIIKGVQPIGQPPVVYSLMLACDAVHADRLVYGDAFRNPSDAITTPVGFTCRTCSREDCGQRAQPSIVQPSVVQPLIDQQAPQDAV